MKTATVINGAWIAIAFFGFISFVGLLISIFGKDFWVALVLGGA